MDQPKQRIPALPREQWTDAARDVFAFWGEPGAWENGSKIQKEMIMAQHPELATAFNTFGKQILLNSSIPERPRELMVLRAAWLHKAIYAWHFHVGYAMNAGVTLAEIEAIRDGTQSPVWDGKPLDRAAIAAVDELFATATLSDATWAALAEHFDTRQMMEVVFTIGAYAMLNWAVNAFGIPLGKEIDALGFDLRTASGKEPLVRFRPGEREDWAETGN